MYVSSIEDLAILAQEIDRKRSNFEDMWICLSRDLDFQDDSSYINPNATTYVQDGVDVEYGDINGDGKNGGLKEELTTEKGFLPIGNAYYENGFKYDKDFMGNFDGQNYTISSLYINRPDDSYVGFIGIKGFSNEGKNSIVRNLNLDNVNMIASDFSGAICGSIVNVDIVNCSVKGNVQTEYQGGAGIVGSAESTNVINCKNYASISSINNSDYISGIVGETFTHNDEGNYIIEECYNYGEITSTTKGYGISGIVGMVDNTNITVDKCVNYGNIHGGQLVGGIVGDNGGVVQNCYNVGSLVSDDKILGGIVGCNSDYGDVPGILKNSYNIGTLTGNEKVAGIIAGGDKEIIVENSYWLETVSDVSIIYASDSETSGETSTEGMKTEEEMKQNNFIELLNAGNTENVWVKDENNMNNGYPILSSQ